LGSEDKIIDTTKVNQFFSMATTYTIKDTGHILKGEDD
jgi:hypothetical protein